MINNDLKIKKRSIIKMLPDMTVTSTGPDFLFCPGY